MLDTTQLPATMTEAWRDYISIGDVVSFRFPVSDKSEPPHPKPRPCLILDIEEIAGTRYAVVSYGTSARTRANSGYESRITDADHYLAMGLARPTRFVGARRLMVPLSHSGFVISSQTGAPVLGRLQGAAMERLNAVRAPSRRARHRRGSSPSSAPGWAIGG